MPDYKEVKHHLAHTRRSIYSAFGVCRETERKRNNWRHPLDPDYEEPIERDDSEVDYEGYDTI